MSELSEDQVQNVRTAAFGAAALVSQAEPGLFDMFKEGMASSKAMAQAPPEVQQVLKSGGLPQRPEGGNAAELESSTLAALRQAMADLGPERSGPFRQVILDACHAAAEAADGTSDKEAAAIAKIEGALADGGTAPAPSS